MEKERMRPITKNFQRDDGKMEVYTDRIARELQADIW